ncbi:MtaA/CmuA family methyltransferase [Candidatus Magnetobacterium casense]|uniref:MtaA/CmuA family methyltransferase n=1 Tax=Candidatus Magnetobacterium casense TaxID=1455061 RepID=A0ABS6S277_9BACT|nr:MtaA/CmuA family methyltransferase [Candidatus Magnetobacterium casensis]MBV6342949.1 MtaA/CmuA family methyltransferase [Candidatus Magnetobacterium casensis]
MTEKERLLGVLRGKLVDRPPVICPGGMMTMASREVMVQTACRWPEVHRDAEKMATLSLAMHRQTGFENLGIPFCMTVEAEAMGGEVEDGDEVTEPRIIQYPLQSVAEWRNLKEPDPNKSGRLPTILECTRILRQKTSDVPVIGNLVGPLSLATSLIEAMTLFKALSREPAEVHGMLGFLTDNSIQYGTALINSGADVIVISDPSATGEILGPRMFREFALPYLNKMITRIHALDIPVIVHICGNIRSLYEPLEGLASEGISVDSKVNIRDARNALYGKKLMGNVCTRLLQKGSIAAIQKVSRELLECGTDILAPACGLSAHTPVSHIKAMTQMVKAEA